MFVVNKSSLDPEKLFECDASTKEILVDRGFMPISSYINDKHIVWCFMITEDLLSALKEVNLM